jgi:hypothetical protein
MVTTGICILYKHPCIMDAFIFLHLLMDVFGISLVLQMEQYY